MNKEKIKQHLNQAVGHINEATRLLDDNGNNHNDNRIDSLEIKGRDFYINGKKKYLIGVSWRQYLQLLSGDRPIHDEPVEKYIGWIVDNGLNYVRHDICSNTGLVANHCEEMRNNGVVVELTLHDQGEASGNVEEVVEATKHLPNVIYEPVNELENVHDCHTAWWWTNRLWNHGGYLTSAGAYGAGQKEWSDTYFKGDGAGNLTNRIITVHRDWNDESIRRYLDPKYQNAPITYLPKPIVRNEFFNMTPGNMMARMRADLENGASGVNYYGDWFTEAGIIAKDYNG